jgi:hypothetical protein
MSGYLSRLASQTGMKIGRTLNSPRTMTPNLQPGLTAPALAPAAGLIEQSVQTETNSLPSQPMPAASADKTPIRSATESRPTESVEASGNLLTEQARLEMAPTSRSNDTRARRDAPEIETGLFSERTPQRESKTTNMSAVSIPGIPVPPTRNPVARGSTATEVIQEVMAWIAGDNSPSSSAPAEAHASGDPASPSMSPASLPMEVMAVVSPVAGSSQAPEPDAESTSVHIGAIHLTIEAPSEKPGPPPFGSPRVSSSPAPAAAPRPVGSRLQRHYLRLC